MKLTKWLAVILISVIVASCYPEKDRSIEDFDIVGTKFSDTVNFDNYQTYILHDSLIVLYDTTEDKPEYPVKEAELILDLIKTNLNNYGWVEAAPNDTPDVYLEATNWNSTVQGVSYYPGWGYPGYGWGYPGYPGWGYPGYGASYYSYTTGTVMIYMMDIKYYAFDDTPVPVIWNGGLNGIMTSGNIESRIEFSINQAFKQSSYLNKK
jgi:hypothetical protein